MASGEQSNRCRSCGAPVLWRAHAKTNRLAPIDARPNPQGNVYLLPDERYEVLTAAQRKAGWVPRTPLHTNHFQTCPHAKGWHDRARQGTA